jgi:ABC-type phosphate transport system substrate-binding protein
MSGFGTRFRLCALVVCGLLCAGFGGAQAESLNIVVITAPQAPRLSFDRYTLRNVFLRKIFVDKDGQRLIPVNLPAGSPLREAFVQEVTHLPDAQQDDYWNRQYFQGVSPPYVLASQQAVVRFVAATPGAIGYVTSCYVDSSVRVVFEFGLPSATATACPAHAAP